MNVQAFSVCLFASVIALATGCPREAVTSNHPEIPSRKAESGYSDNTPKQQEPFSLEDRIRYIWHDQVLLYKKMSLTEPTALAIPFGREVVFLEEGNPVTWGGRQGHWIKILTFEENRFISGWIFDQWISAQKPEPLTKENLYNLYIRFPEGTPTDTELEIWVFEPDNILYRDSFSGSDQSAIEWVYTQFHGGTLREQDNTENEIVEFLITPGNTEAYRNYLSRNGDPWSYTLEKGSLTISKEGFPDQIYRCRPLTPERWTEEILLYQEDGEPIHLTVPGP